MVKRDFEILNPKSSSLITSEDQLRDFCNSNKLAFEIVNLSELESFKKPYAFIHTGAEKDQFNGGNTNHWMFIVGNKIFDSYGLQEDFLLPSWCQYIRLQPKRIQEYGSNVCGEYCCTFYKFVKSSADQNDQDLGVEYCDSLGFSEDRNKNDKIVQAVYAQEGGRLKTQNSNVQGGALDLNKVKFDVSMFHRKYRGSVDDYLQNLIGPRSFNALSSEDRRTLYHLMTDPKTAHSNNDLFQDLWQRNRANPDVRSGIYHLVDQFDRAENPLYQVALRKVYDEGYTKEQQDYWRKHSTLLNPSPVSTSTAPDDIPIKDPAAELTPPMPGGKPDAQPAVIPIVPTGSTSESNAVTTTTSPPTIPTGTMEPETGVTPGEPILQDPKDPGWTPPGPGAEAPNQKVPPIENPQSWFDKIREFVGHKKQPGDDLPKAITNPPFQEFPWNFDKSNTQLPEPVNFPIPNTTPMPEVIRQGTIALQPVEPYLPNQTPSDLLNTTIPQGPANPRKRMRLDGTLETVPKKSKGAVTAFQTIQTYVPMPQEITTIDTVPFQYPQFQMLTAVPQLATMDKGFFKAGTNKLLV